MAKRTLIIAVLVVCIVIVLAYFIPFPLSGTKSVHIVSSVSISQGGDENNTEIVKVNGAFFNDGDIIAKNLTAIVIFTDSAHNKIVRKTVKEGVDLLPNKQLTVEFESEYFRERTIPKTHVNVTVQFDWIENGQLKTTAAKNYLSE